MTSSTRPGLPADELRRVFGDIPVSSLVVERIHEPIVGATVGLWRVRHEDRSVVLKVLAHTDAGHEHWRSSDDEADWLYWRREACAYESPLFHGLPDGLRAPACRLVAVRPDGSVALWLEDVKGTPASAWSLERYGLAAEHLGRWQGQALTTAPILHEPWLSRGWLRGYLTQRDGDDQLLADSAAWRHRLLAESFDGHDIDRLRAMRADRPWFLTALESLPTTLCHLDVHPGNLFTDPDGTTCAIDWAFVGIGNIGEDVANLVPDTVFDFHVAPGDIGELDELVTDCYLRGLNGAGIVIDRADVRLGMTAAMAAKYAWIGPSMLRAAVEERELLNGRPIADTIRAWAPPVRYLLERADEARRLAGL